jgi:glucokinase
MPHTSNQPILAVDIGGTKVAAGLVSSSGKILLSTRVPMIPDRSAREGLLAVFSAIDQIRRDPRSKNSRGLGISVPGWIDSHRGVLIKAANLPCWRDFSLASRLSAQYALPARIANDADAAALAEAVWGAGSKSENVFYVSLGTGIGTGMVRLRQICLGRGGSAFEGGHMTIDFQGVPCPCGKKGCIERYASGTAIARLARKLLRRRAAGSSRTLSLAGGKLENVTSEIVAQAARSRDALAASVLREAAAYLAVWLGNIIDLLEPDLIIFGGGLAPVMLSHLPRIRRELDHWAINPRRRQIPIVAARFAAESALVGAAALFHSVQ